MSITEVAKRAKVSIATVSRVLNNSRSVDEAVAGRVRVAAKELRYVPLRRRRAGNTAGFADSSIKHIALISVGHPAREWFGVPVLASVIAELTREANARGMSVTIEELVDVRRLANVLKQREIDAALAFVSSSAGPGAVGELAEYLPVVQVLGSPLIAPKIDYVGPDNGRVGCIAAEYLIARGCKSLGVLSTAPQWDFTMLRAQGFAGGMRGTRQMPQMFLMSAEARGLECYGPRLKVKATLSELVDEVVASRLDGLFFTRDAEMVEAYHLLHARGVVPGRDITFISCDNEDVRLSALSKRPASIDLNPAEIAKRAVKRLENRAERRDEPAVRVLIEPAVVDSSVV